MLTRRKFNQLSFLSLLAASSSCAIQPRKQVVAPSKTEANSDLYILWERGYLPQENEGIQTIVSQWEKISGRKVQLKLASDDFIENLLVNILERKPIGEIPDIVLSVSFNHLIAPLLAWNDLLLDLNELITPLNVHFSPQALAGVQYDNSVQGDRSYYAIPIGQAGSYLHCWKDSLSQFGYSANDVPKDWFNFWSFWQQMQNQVNKNPQFADTKAIGLSLAPNGFDTSAAFDLFIKGYNIKIFDSDQQLLITEPENRKRLAAALQYFAQLYREQLIPSEAQYWSGSGNNTAFLNRRVLMTLNITLSIPRSQKLADNPYNLASKSRYEAIHTFKNFPNDINGTPIKPNNLFNQILALKKQHPHPETLDFLKYVLEFNQLKQLLGGFKGRIIPVMPKMLDIEPWNNISDPHTQAALTLYPINDSSVQIKSHPIRSEIYLNQIWAQCLQKVIFGKEPASKVANWGINQIQSLWETHLHLS